MKLKIIYQAKEVKTLLDKVLIKTLKEMGFKETGSGYLFKTQERDINFENKNENQIIYMEKEKINLEDLWDWICVHIGFDKNGKEIQKAIRLFIKLKIKKIKEKKDEEINNAFWEGKGDDW